MRAKRARCGDTWNVRRLLCRVNDRRVLFAKSLEVKVVFDDTSSAHSFTSDVGEAEACVESTLASEVASTVSTTITATLGEFTVVKNDDGHDVKDHRESGRRQMHHSGRGDHRASVKFNAASNSQLQMNTMRTDGSSQQHQIILKRESRVCRRHSPRSRR